MSLGAGASEPSSQGGRLAPPWLDNLAALGWRVLVIVAFAVLLWFMATLIWNVVAAIALAVIVSVILAPLVLGMRSRGRSRTAAAGLTWLVAIGAALGLLLLLAVSLWPYLAELVDRMGDGSAALDTWVTDQALPPWLADSVTQAVQSAQGISEEALTGIVGSLANLVGILVLGAFLLFFFLRDGDLAWLWLFQAMDADKRERITTAGDVALVRVGRYVRATTVTAAVSAITNLAFMLVLGTPLALPLALLTFVLGYVPYFGGVAAGLLVVLVTYGATDAWTAVIMAGLVLARAVVVRFTVRPRLHEHAFTIHPVVVLVALPVGFHFGGLVGLILAVPLVAIGLSVAQAALDIIEPEAPPDLPGIVPGWLDRAAQWSWRAIVAIAFVGLLMLVLTTVPLVLLPVILALLFAATVLPLVEALVRRGWARGTAVAASVGGSTVAVIGVLVLAMVSLVRQAGEIGDTTVEGASSVDEAAGGQLGLATDALEAGVQAGTSLIASIGSDVVGLTMVGTLAVLLTFYFLRDGAALWASLMAHIRRDAAAELSSVGQRAFGVLGGYMIGTGAISLVGAASQLVIMWILGIPLALPIFVLSLFGGYIPYIGSLLTTGVAFLVTFAVGDPIDIVVMGGWTVLFNIVQGNVVAPLVYSRTTSIHPAIVLAAIPAGSAVAGILGMFLVVPVLGVISVSWRSVLRVIGGDEDPATIAPETTDAPSATVEPEPA